MIQTAILQVSEEGECKRKLLLFCTFFKHVWLIRLFVCTQKVGIHDICVVNMSGLFVEDHFCADILNGIQ